MLRITQKLIFKTRITHDWELQALCNRITETFRWGGTSGGLRSNPALQAQLPCKWGQVGQGLVQLSFKYLQQWRSHHHSWPCPKAALFSWEGVFLLMCNQHFPCFNVSLLSLTARDKTGHFKTRHPCALLRGGW